MVELIIYVLMNGDGYGHDNIVDVTLDENVARKHEEDGGWVETYYKKIELNFKEKDE